MSEETWDTPEKVTAIRAAGKEAGLAHIFLSDEELLRRYLRARRGDIKLTTAMLLETQKWRRAETPWWPHQCCPLSHIAADWKSGKAYVHGEDSTGSPLAFVQAALHDKNEARETLKQFISFLNDEAVARLESSTVQPKPSQMTIIVSFVSAGGRAWRCSAHPPCLLALAHPCSTADLFPTTLPLPSSTCSRPPPARLGSATMLALTWVLAC
jgi:hypothetical protein